jgi:hypothetical protein
VDERLDREVEIAASRRGKILEYTSICIYIYICIGRRMIDK